MMVGFWAAAVVMVVAVLIALLWPLVRPAAAAPAGSEPAMPSLAVFQAQLEAVQSDLGAGLMSAEEAAAAEAEIGRRLIAAEARDRAAANRPPGPGRMMAVAIIAALLPAGSVGLYLAIGSPGAIGRTAATVTGTDGSPHTAGEMVDAARKLQERLAKDPNDAEGWVLLGRTQASLSHWTEARAAFARAAILLPDEPVIHSQLGEVIALENDGTVTDEAAAELAKAPNDPRSRFYSAIRLAQKGDADGARAGLKGLLADAPPDAPWRALVADQLAQLDGGPAAGSEGNPPGGTSGAAPGPTPDQMAAAAQMAPEDRQQMIRQMVEGLAKRLESTPGDKAGWERLANAYDVLGEKDKADAARAKAAAASGLVRPASPPAATPPALGGPGTASPRGPTADQVKAAGQMSPEDRQAMIRSMVEGLAQRLEQNPNDKAGWERLANAYDVLGETAKAANARQRAAAVASGTPPAASGAPAAPAPATLAPVGPESPQAGPTNDVVEAKVQALATRLETNPQDVSGWLELARDWQALGHDDRALAALKRANERLPANMDLLMAYADGLASGIRDEKLPPEFVTVMGRINAIDPKQEDALWYLGLDAAQRGDRRRASTYWSKLAAGLPENSPERLAVQRRLDALP